MPKSFVFTILVIVVVTYASEPGHWEKSMELNINFNMSNYSDNWTGGDVGGINWVANSNILAQKQFNNWFHWKNTLKMSFGQTHSQDAETGNWLLPQKSTDLIEFESIGRFTVTKFVDPYAAVNLKSQFYDKCDVENPRYFNPINLKESAGFARVFIKTEKRELTSRVGFGIRQHINRDVMIAEDDYETQTTNDGGLEWVTELRTPLANERISYYTKLTVFNAVYYSEAEELEGTPQEDYWKAPDIDWEHIFTANITEHLMVNLYFQLLYDKEIDLKGRHKETLSVGFTYNLF